MPDAFFPYVRSARRREVAERAGEDLLLTVLRVFEELRTDVRLHGRLIEQQQRLLRALHENARRQEMNISRVIDLLPESHASNSDAYGALERRVSELEKKLGS